MVLPLPCHFLYSLSWTSCRYPSSCQSWSDQVEVTMGELMVESTAIPADTTNRSRAIRKDRLTLGAEASPFALLP